MSCYLSSLYKSEDPAEYAKRASEGMMLGFPVKIGGQSHNPITNIGYHSTIKVFDRDKDHAHQIHHLAQRMQLNPPDAQNTQIEPSMFKDRNGSDVYVLKLHGRSADKIKEHNSKFSRMGHPQPFEYQAHVSVDKPMWDKIKASGAKTAHEAGISFGNAELRHGNKTIKTYHHQPDTTEPSVPDQSDISSKIPLESQMPKLASSEKHLFCPLHKSESEPKALQSDEDAHTLMNRKEDKYFLPRRHLERVVSELSDRFALGDIDTDTRYCRNRTVYLDDKDLSCMRDCVSKTTPRHKVRIRQYSPNNQGWEKVAYAEFKIKEDDGQTKKIRVRIPADLVDSLSEGGKITFDEALVNINRDLDRRVLESRVNFINHAIARKGLRKQLELQYERRAYSGKNLRITIDDDLNFFDARSIDPTVKKLMDQEEGWAKFIKPYLFAAWEDPLILEIKSGDDVPKWLKKLLEEVEAEKTPFSKYAAGTITHLKTDAKNGKILSTHEEKPVDMAKTEDLLGMKSLLKPKKADKAEKVSMPKEDFVAEHKDLVDVLKHPSKKKLQRELKEQSEELQEELAKGALQNVGVALGMAGALAGASHSVDAKGRSPASVQQMKPQAPAYDHNRMLNAIAEVESSSGKNLNHKPTAQGTAYGRYALMPNTIHDTIKGHKDLMSKHGKALALQGAQLHRYMQDHKDLEDVIANRHLAHIEHNFKGNLENTGFAWNQGVTGTKKARNSGKDIANHPYTQKIKEAYGKVK